MSGSLKLAFGVERKVTAPFSGSFQAVGSALADPAVIVIFDNQSTVAVEVSLDGVNTWKTFAASSAAVLDVRTNHGKSWQFAVPVGTQFYVKGSAGTGFFSIATNYEE